jgi:glycosyltransferase involved in cell wall biosynthesis
VTVRLLCFIESFWPKIGGMETFTAHLLTGLVERGYEVTVMTSRDDARLPEQEEHLGMTIHRFDLVPTVSGGDVDALLTLRREVTALRKTVRPEIVHVAFPGVAGYFALSSASADQAPTVLRVHTLWAAKEGSRHAVFRRLLDSASWVTTVSQAALTDLRSFAPDVTDRSSVLYSGVHDHGMEPQDLSFDTPILLAAGRLAPEKGFDVLLRACEVLRRDGADIRVVIAGDGPERAGLSTLVDELRLSDRVEMIGWVPTSGMWSLLDRATVVAVPSRWDAFPRIAVEAALMARPVVASAVGGLIESVVHGETGLLVDAGDEGALAGAIRSLVRDPDRARSMGAAGRARALDRFTMDAVVEAHDHLYRRLLS